MRFHWQRKWLRGKQHGLNFSSFIKLQREIRLSLLLLYLGLSQRQHPPRLSRKMQMCQLLLLPKPPIRECSTSWMGRGMLLSFLNPALRHLLLIKCNISKPRMGKLSRCLNSQLWLPTRRCHPQRTPRVFIKRHLLMRAVLMDRQAQSRQCHLTIPRSNPKTCSQCKALRSRGTITLFHRQAISSLTALRMWQRPILLAQ
mmetsp:Transcript_26910/g.70785  ORF Transcript_26910/g.70785 Transcript_26910/m.70785 type:complete len:200 (-) Transcript_26910:1139-1738(-)